MDQHEEALNPVLDSLGDKTKSHMVPETLCAILRLRLKDMLQLCIMICSPDGLFPGLIRGLTDVHIHEWLRSQVPLESQFRFYVVWPQSVGREKDRIRYLHANVWDVENYACYEEHKSKADELSRNEISKGFVQWAVNRRNIVQDVVALQLAVFPRVKDIVGGVMKLLEDKDNGEGVDFLTLDFRHTFIQLRVVRHKDLSWLELPWGVSSRTKRVVRSRIRTTGVMSVAAWVTHSTQAWMSNDRAKTNCFVDDPIIPLKGTAHQRRKLAMGVLLWWNTPGLKLAYEKESFGPKAVWIGTQLEINAKVNKIVVRLPVKQNQEILEALAHIMDSPGGMVRHYEVRRIAGKVSWVASFLPQSKPFMRQLWASLCTVAVQKASVACTDVRMVHGQRQGELVKLCRLAHRRGILWSVENPTTLVFQQGQKFVRGGTRALCPNVVVSGLHQRGV